LRCAAIRKAGALDYVEKPFDLDAFVEIVRMTVSGGDAGERGLRGSVEEAERAAILEALVRNGWAISKTADGLGVSRKNLWEKMRRYRIERL
jgi:DNA-binding NtrC family response regulator